MNDRSAETPTPTADTTGIQSTPTEPTAPDPMKPLPTRTWWHRHLEPEERRRVMSDLAITRQEHWAYRFTVMLTLSVIVAVMGLSADSAAVVIGAMLLAPLMQPVLATAGCLSMALFKKALSAFSKVALASVWSIGLAYLLSKFVTIDNTTLPREVVSRTAPDIRDLVVALGAGAAGAYATVRRDASAALPGVAVAVALVPPLGAVGIALETGNMTFARGALLLYLTNLAAIILAGVFVFVVTGFVPPRRLATTSGRLMAAGITAAAIVVAVAVPLYRASRSAQAASDRQIVAQDIVQEWLNGVETSQRPVVELDGDRILVSVRSFDPPIDRAPVQESLRSALGSDLAVSVEWDRVEQATTTTTEAPTTTVKSDADLLLESVEPIVRRWLADDDSDNRLEGITITGSDVRVDASGVGQPPSVADLTGELDETIDQTLSVQLTWVERQDVTATVPPPTDIELQTQRMLVTAEVWSEGTDVVVRELRYDGERVTLELSGVDPPETDELVLDLQLIAGADIPVDVFFSQQTQLTTTTTTTTTEPDTTATTTN